MARFLIIDDHPIYLAGLKGFVEDSFPRAICETVTSGRAALYLVAKRPDFDIAIVDLNLPDIGGDAIIAGLKARGCRARTLVLSGTFDRKAADRLRSAGADDFASKSDEPTRIVEKIKALLSGTADPMQPDTAENPELLGAQLGISARQFEVLRLLDLGLPNKDIAQTLNITEPTVKSHVAALFRSLDAKTRSACVRRARDLGVLG